MSKVTAFLRHLVARERLPRDEAPLPPRRRGFLRTLVAWEVLPRDEEPTPARSRSLLRWLVSFERLPEDRPGQSAPGDGGKDREPHGGES